jgi:hypothetical protein
MAIKNGAKIVAHSRLAVEIEGKIILFTPGEVITVGPVVSAEQAEDWLERGSAGLPTAEDLKAGDDVANALAARTAKAAADAAEAATPAPAAAE